MAAETHRYRNLRTGGVGDMTEKQAEASPAKLEIVSDDAKPALDIMWHSKVDEDTLPVEFEEPEQVAKPTRTSKDK